MTYDEIYMMVCEGLLPSAILKHEKELIMKNTTQQSDAWTDEDTMSYIESQEDYSSDNETYNDYHSLGFNSPVEAQVRCMISLPLELYGEESPISELLEEWEYLDRFFKQDVFMFLDKEDYTVEEYNNDWNRYLELENIFNQPMSVEIEG